MDNLEWQRANTDYVSGADALHTGVKDASGYPVNMSLILPLPTKHWDHSCDGVAIIRLACIFVRAGTDNLSHD